LIISGGQSLLGASRDTASRVNSVTNFGTSTFFNQILPRDDSPTRPAPRQLRILERLLIVTIRCSFFWSDIHLHVEHESFELRFGSG